MKIGIMTFYNTTNYGALLQAVALQKAINKLDSECETIQYRCTRIEQRELPMVPQNYNGFKSYSIKWLGYIGKKRKKMKMLSFEKLMKTSSKVYSSDDIELAGTVYDKIIVGSDIVWDIEITDDYSFFLEFIEPKKRFAYSASFGHADVPEEAKRKISTLLSEFNKISVRESSGKRWIENHIGRVVEVTLDPTLLLTDEEWRSLCDWKPKLTNYIVLYFLDKQGYMLNEARRIAKKSGKKIVVIHDGLKHIRGVYNIKHCSVEEFLGWIKYSDMVITASYHGMIFALNFKKQLLFFNRAHAERMKTIAKLLGIESNEIIPGKVANESMIDYSKVDEMLAIERIRSYAYLRSILEE